MRTASTDRTRGRGRRPVVVDRGRLLAAYSGHGARLRSIFTSILSCILFVPRPEFLDFLSQFCPLRYEFLVPV